MSLRGAKFALQHEADFGSDIARLRALSDREIRYLSSHTMLEFRNRTVHVERDVLTQLTAAALEGPHLLITGAAGTGKSGLLHDLAGRIQAEGNRTVVVSSDTLVSRSDWDASLGLSHPLPEVLRGWDGVGDGFLFIDALDAVRLGVRVQDLLRLIEDVQHVAPAWRVVVAVREFDLQYNPPLQRLFRGSPVDPDLPTSAELPDVRAFHVRAFTARDVSQLREAAPELIDAARAVEPRFGASIWSPINLRLLARVMTEGADSAELEELRRPLDLWDCYWTRCVVGSSAQGGALAPGRELVVESIVSAMVRLRSLSLRPAEFPSTADDGALPLLVSDGVLRRVQRGGATRYEFTHHALFDYAASRVSFAIAASDVFESDQLDLDALFVFRPSVLLAFERLWWETSRPSSGGPPCDGRRLQTARRL